MVQKQVTNSPEQLLTKERKHRTQIYWSAGAHQVIRDFVVKRLPVPAYRYAYVYSIYNAFSSVCQKNFAGTYIFCLENDMEQK